MRKLLSIFFILFALSVWQSYAVLLTSNSVVTYTGNGTSTNFTIPYYFLYNSNLYVTVWTNGSTNFELRAEGVHYSVTGAQNFGGGTLTMYTAPLATETVRVERIVPIIQVVDYINSDSFPAETHERTLDYLTMICQQLDQGSSALAMAAAYAAQQALNYITNVNTNITGFIKDLPGVISNGHLKANIIRSSNIVDGTITEADISVPNTWGLRADGQNFTASSNNVVGLGATPFEIISPAQVTHPKIMQMHFFIYHGSVDISGGDKVYSCDIGVQVSSDNVSYSNELRTGASIIRLAAFGGGSYASTPGNFTFVVPSNHWYKVYASAQSTNLIGSDWTLAWQRTINLHN